MLEQNTNIRMGTQGSRSAVAQKRLWKGPKSPRAPLWHPLARLGWRSGRRTYWRVEDGDGRQRQQGDPDRQSRRGPGGAPDPGRPADRQLARGDLGDLARPEQRRAEGKDQVAPGGDRQRAPLPD